jgi:hypothetical protein
MKRILLLLMIVCGSIAHLSAQEIEAIVMVQPPTTMQGVDFTIFQQFQKDITDYINRNRFTDHTFDPKERIRCNFTVILDQLPQGNIYTGSLQIKATRPVYNSTYETLIFNFNDKEFRANYTQGEGLIFSPNAYTGNLTALINFYMYLILGFDYDSFSLGGGQPFFQKALEQLQMASTQSEPGWGQGSNGGRYNRFYLVNHALDNTFKEFHQVMYSYHREGLDKMADDVNGGRITILEALKTLQKIQNDNPFSALLRFFVELKSPQGASELVNIFRKAQPNDKQQFITIMQQLDANNGSMYAEVLKEE